MSAWIKLAIGTLIIAAVTSYMAYVGASSSWKYYVTTDECLADLDQFKGSRLRVSGAVVDGTLQIDEARSRASFELQGAQGNLQVRSVGRLPDNLEECSEVVVEGRLAADCVLHGDKILTKCASKYQEKRNASTKLSADEGQKGAL